MNSSRRIKEAKTFWRGGSQSSGGRGGGGKSRGGRGGGRRVAVAELGSQSWGRRVGIAELGSQSLGRRVGVADEVAEFGAHAWPRRGAYLGLFEPVNVKSPNYSPQA